MEELVSRAELAGRAQDLGLKVTERTLRYWAYRGLIPKPALREGRAYYSLSLLGDLRAIESLRRKPIEEVKSIVLGRATSSIFDYEVSRSDGVVTITVRSKKGEKT